MSARQNKDLKVYQLHGLTKIKICEKLDIRNHGKDFKTFAAMIGMPPWDAASIFDQDDPTEEILRWWEPKREATVKNLRKILEEMKRQDILDILDEDPTQGNQQEVANTTSTDGVDTTDSGMTERETGRASTENNPNLPEIQLVKMKDINPTKIEWSEATKDPTDVLLVVVNNIEFRAAYQILTEPKSADSKTVLGRVYFGQIGENNVALVRSSMGPGGNTGMERTCREGIKQLGAKTVISVGICFGMKDRKQKLGDVVVSTKFAPYEFSRANRDGSLEFRGTITECNRRMTRLFEDGEAGWNSPVESDVHCGLMISGSKLVDDEDLKKRLQKLFPAALAGEMEGEGLKNACEDLDLEPHQRPPWIICKAISDWGDGTKNREWQPCAAATAASYVKHILEQYYVPGEEGNAEESMKTAVEEAVEFGKKRNNRISLFFIGADGVGKTTLKRRLLGEDIDFQEPSTVGIEVDIVEVEETNKKKPWKRTQDQQRMVSNEHYNEVIGKEAAKRIKEPSVEEKPQRSISDKRIEDPECSNAAETTSDGETTNITNVEAAKETEYVPPAKDIMERRRDRKIIEEISLSLELMEAIRVNMAKVGQYDDDELDKIRLLLQDVAGQSLFYDVHAMFLNIRALYILVVSLDKDLLDKAEPLFVDKKTKMKIPIENYLVESNLDYVNKWMGALDNVSQGSTPRKNLPHVATFLVFTKSDKIPGNEEERESKIQEAIDTVLNSFTDHHFRRHIVGTFVIDNTNPEDPELLRLREEIFKTSRKSAMSQEKISINWLRLERGLATLMNEAPYIRFKTLAQWLKVSEEDATQDMVEALRFLHQQSVIIYFHEEDQARDLVVLDPQWLVDLFTRIINIPSTQERSPENAGLWKRLEDRGELSSELLHLVLAEHENHLQALTSIMERVGLICRWNEETWLVPSMAPPKKETEEAHRRLQSCNISALWIDFGGLVALGLFTRLQVYFLGLSSILSGKCPRLYCDFSCIHLTEDNVKYSIVLVQYASRIQVTFGGDDGAIPHDKLPVVASKVMFFLRKALEEIRDSSPVYEAIDFRFAVKCDCNQPVNTKCPRHQKKGCSSEDCQHLIPLEDLKGDGFCCEITTDWYDAKKGSPWLGYRDLNTIYGLPPVVYKSVCSMLKKSSVGKGFRALAALFGYPGSRVEWLSSYLFDVILVHWTTQEGHDLDTFIEILKNAEKNDVVEILTEQDDPGEESSSTMSARQNKDLKVNKLHAMTRIKICEKLNIPNDGKDFKTFAAKIDMPGDRIALISEKNDRTEAILRWWETKKEATVKNLRRILEEMDRDDILEILDEDPTQGSGRSKRPADQDKDEIDAGGKRPKTATKLKGSGQKKRPADQDEDKGDVGRKRRKMTTKPEGQPKWWKIQDINAEIYEKLCEQLNKSKPGKDYIALAGKMKYDEDKTEGFALSKNPAKALLGDWKTESGHDVPQLIKHLREIKRDDLIKLFEH